MSGDLEGRVIVVTGGSAGIGEAAVREFRRRGAHVLLTGRSPRTHEIARETGAEAHLVDFGDFTSVRRFADRVLADHKRLDVLCNNVGMVSGARHLTVDGHERVFQTNHLSGFLLTALLTPLLEASNGRVIDTSSAANLAGRFNPANVERDKGYASFAAYADSKLMNILHIMELARRHPRIGAAAFHPGVVSTDLAREGGWKERMAYSPLSRRLFMISPERGADTLVWLATAPRDQWVSGEYYSKRKRARLRSPFATEENARALWDLSEKLVGFA